MWYSPTYPAIRIPLYATKHPYRLLLAEWYAIDRKQNERVTACLQFKTNYIFKRRYYFGKCSHLQPYRAKSNPFIIIYKVWLSSDMSRNKWAAYREPAALAQYILESPLQCRNNRSWMEPPMVILSESAYGCWQYPTAPNRHAIGWRSRQQPSPYSDNWLRSPPQRGVSRWHLGGTISDPSRDLGTVLYGRRPSRVQIYVLN